MVVKHRVPIQITDKSILFAVPSTCSTFSMILATFSGEAVQPGVVRFTALYPALPKKGTHSLRLLAPISTIFFSGFSGLAVSRLLTYPWTASIRHLNSSLRVSLDNLFMIAGHELAEQKVVVWTLDGTAWPAGSGTF